jgi:hypothetical protein
MTFRISLLAPERPSLLSRAYRRVGYSSTIPGNTWVDLFLVCVLRDHGAEGTGGCMHCVRGACAVPRGLGKPCARVEAPHVHRRGDVVGG